MTSNNNEYLKLKEFWNEYFKNIEKYVVSGKFVNDDNFNGAVEKYIKADSKVLDFGCGSGWGLIEIAYTVNIMEGIGVDQSSNAIDIANLAAEASNMQNLNFIVGDENTLSNYCDYFDSVISINTFDVVSDEVLENMTLSCNNALKKNGYLLVSINPDFPLDVYEKNGYEIKNGYIYKDGILRGNYKTTEQWIEFFSQYYKFEELITFALSDIEKKYPRRMFVLKK
jgi:cyclopropane fatty-acyl-phospholipid synthase-like methyltransferase